MKNLVNFIKERSWGERVVLSTAIFGIGGITVWQAYYAGFVAHDCGAYLIHIAQNLF